MQSTTSNFVQPTLRETFQMRIFYELYTKGCVFNLTHFEGDGTIPKFRHLDFPDTLYDPIYCAWYIPTFKYPVDIYLIFFNYFLYPFRGSRSTCYSWQKYGSLWVTNLTKDNQANIIWKRCSSNSRNLEIIKVSGKESPWISVNFYSPKPSEFGFYSGGFYSESTCGGAITKGFEKINFYFEDGYGDDRFCTWIFTPVFSQDYYEQATTYIIFHYFKLEGPDTTGCLDYVRILYYDNKVNEFTHRLYWDNYFCKMPDRNPVILQKQNIAVQFKSDPGIDDNGFIATVIQTWSGCGGVINVTKPMTYSRHIANIGPTLCSWFFYGEEKFHLKLKVEWIIDCAQTNVRVYDLSMDNYEQSRLDICQNGVFHFISNKIVIQLSGYRKEQVEVYLLFVLNYNKLDRTSTVVPSQALSTSIHSSSTLQFSTKLFQTQLSTKAYPSSAMQSQFYSPSKSVFLSLSSSQLNTTIIVKGQNKEVIGRLNFTLLGGIIGVSLFAVLFMVVFFVFYRRRQRQSLKKDSVINTESDKNGKADSAVFYEHRPSKVALVNQDSNSLEAKSDFEPFVKIGKNSEKSVKRKAKTSFGKEIVELEDEQDGKGLVNKSYEDSGDECELYESQEESPLSGFPRISYSRGNPLYSLYGSPNQSHSSNLDDEGEDDIFLPKNQMIPVKKAPLKRSERESSNSLYGIYESNETTDIPSIPNVEEIKKKKKSLETSEDTVESNIYSDSENIYAPASVYAPSGFYASTSNPLYGRQSTAPENSLDINQYYAPHTTTNVSDDNEYYAPHEATTVGSKSAKLTNQRYSSSPEIIEEQNYACPDVSPPLSVNQITEEQEYSYATHPGVPNVEESNMLYGYQQPNVNMNNEEDRAVDDFSQDNALYG